MNFAHQHTIEKVFIEVTTSDEKTAYKIKDSFSAFLRDEVFPELEKVVNKLGINGHVLRLDKVCIDCKMKDWENRSTLKYNLINMFEQQLREQVAENQSPVSDSSLLLKKTKANKNNLTGLINNAENQQATFIYFLENGVLPWFGKQEYINDLLVKTNWEKALANKNFIAELKRILRSKSKAAQRFFFQHTDEQIFAFIVSNDFFAPNQTSKVTAFVSDLSIDTKQIYLKLLLNISLKIDANKVQDLFVKFVCERLRELNMEKHFTEAALVDELKNTRIELHGFFKKEIITKYFSLTQAEIEQLVRKFVEISENQIVEKDRGGFLVNLENRPTINFQDFESLEKEKESPRFLLHNRGEFVRNAGLVLFHPFIKTLFTGFGWISKTGALKRESQFQAIQLLHYCATGKESFFEGNLVLEKFFCNVSLETPIPAKSLLTESIKKEADEMLSQLIDYWPALKNTSPQGLREMFIDRNGKLIQKDNSYQLIVERKVQDILLEKLQWNISIVKLPWKKELLFIDW